MVRIQPVQWFFLFAYGVTTFASQSEAALLAVRNASRTLLDIDSFSEAAIKTFFMFLGYLFQYLALAGIFEYTNPAPKTEKRIASMKKEIQMGVGVTAINILFAVLWLYFVDPYTPHYGYFVDHPLDAWAMIRMFAVYFVFADTWFYWTHRLLHVRWFWQNVHFQHHSFVQPTAFCQDAVHWFEATLQGPCGHFFASLIVPMHPVFLAVAGFLTAAYAIAAHDGRALDINSHMRHHTHKKKEKWPGQVSGVNFGLYWGLWDYICGTRYSADCDAWTPVRNMHDLSDLAMKPESYVAQPAAAAAGKGEYPVKPKKTRINPDMKQSINHVAKYGMEYEMGVVCNKKPITHLPSLVMSAK